jgi:hypothetical protein
VIPKPRLRATSAPLKGAIFARQLQGTWSPAEHLDHLNIAVSAVARGFGMSPLILRLGFGSSKRQSRTYEELRADYQSRLAAGGRASGRFVPVRETTDPADAAIRFVELLPLLFATACAGDSPSRAAPVLPRAASRRREVRTDTLSISARAWA